MQAKAAAMLPYGIQMLAKMPWTKLFADTMTHRIIAKWGDKLRWFRDVEQCNDVATVILHRFADDRIEDECRYLTRLKWHLHMAYQEVSYDELLVHVSPQKMMTLHRLFDAIVEGDYEAIDAWVLDISNNMPIVEDNWINNNRDSKYVADLLDNDGDANS